METTGNRVPTAYILSVVQFLVGILLFAALLNGQQDLTVLAVLVFAMGIGSNLWSRLGERRVCCDAEVDKRRLFPDEGFCLTASVQNQKFLPVWIQLTFALGDAFRMAAGSGGASRDGSLFWYQQVRFELELTARHRGVFQVGPPELWVADLFGFYPRKKTAAERIEVVVYPRLIPLKTVAVPKRDFFGIPGVKSPVEDPVYVYGTRDYQHSRPARYIHWKASARYSRLQEKLCEPAAQEKILLVLDVSRFHHHQARDVFEKTIETAGSAAVRFYRRGYAVGLATNGLLTGGGPRIVPVARADRQIPRILEMLARVQIEPLDDVVEILKRGLKLPWGATCMSFSHDTEPPLQSLSAFFKHRNVPVVSVVYRPGSVQRAGRPERLDHLIALEDLWVNRADDGGKDLP